MRRRASKASQVFKKMLDEFTHKTLKKKRKINNNEKTDVRRFHKKLFHSKVGF